MLKGILDSKTTAKTIFTNQIGTFVYVYFEGKTFIKRPINL